MKHIITIQHAQSAQHTNGMVGSWTDWPLTALGMERAECIGRNLATELSDRSCKIYSSDLLRARQTAEPLASYLGADVEYRADLRELNLGMAVGKTKQWMREHSAPVRTVDDRPFPDAESSRDVWNRASALCDEIMRGTDDWIVLVSHSHYLQMWFGVWMKWDIGMYQAREFDGSHAGGVSFMGENEAHKRVLSRLNDLSYMR